MLKMLAEEHLESHTGGQLCGSNRTAPQPIAAGDSRQIYRAWQLALYIQDHSKPYAAQTKAITPDRRYPPGANARTRREYMRRACVPHEAKTCVLPQQRRSGLLPLFR